MDEKKNVRTLLKPSDSRGTYTEKKLIKLIIKYKRNRSRKQKNICPGTENTEKNDHEKN